MRNLSSSNANGTCYLGLYGVIRFASLFTRAKSNATRRLLLNGRPGNAALNPPPVLHIFLPGNHRAHPLRLGGIFQVHGGCTILLPQDPDASQNGTVLRHPAWHRDVGTDSCSDWSHVGPRARSNYGSRTTKQTWASGHQRKESRPSCVSSTVMKR